jgi:CRP-like cAMP-binding protein
VTGLNLSALTPALRKLQLWEDLSDGDASALLDLPHQTRTLRTRQYFVREDERPRNCCLLLEGFGIRHKTTGDGRRQIFSIHMPGDFIDLHNSLLRVADHSIEALIPKCID